MDHLAVVYVHDAASKQHAYAHMYFRATVYALVKVCTLQMGCASDTNRKLKLSGAHLAIKSIVLQGQILQLQPI
jgi:hypothetical protein